MAVIDGDIVGLGQDLARGQKLQRCIVDREAPRDLACAIAVESLVTIGVKVPR